MLSRLVSEINRNEFHMDTKIKEKLALLYDAQVQFNNVYEDLKECLSKKKGDIRSCVGGRYSFSSRSFWSYKYSNIFIA